LLKDKNSNKLAERSIVGKWISPEFELDLGPHPGWFIYRFQFDPDDTFVYARIWRKDYCTIMRYGTYLLRGNTLLLDIERGQCGGTPDIHKPMNFLKVSWEGEDLILDSNMAEISDHYGGKPVPVRVHLYRTDYPDMNKVDAPSPPHIEGPPPGWKSKKRKK